MFLNKKYRGYLQDSSKTTHPISGEVKDTEEATTIFDGITYQKGASTLKCLLNTVGEQKFGKAMENYFYKYAYKNTELKDLLACIQEQTTVDIDLWRA
jgi:aminopeptidase N